MNAALPLASADDPLLPAVITASLKSCKIDQEWAQTIENLATGKISPRTLQCCGSGCRPCTQDILRCAMLTLRTMQDPAAAKAASDQATGRRKKARRIAGRLASGLRRRIGGE